MKYANKEYLILAASMLAFTAVLYWLTRWEALPWTAAGLLLLLIIPPTGLLLVRLWKSCSHGVNQLVNGLLLAFLFFLILSPLAVLRRAVNRKTASRRPTYYEEKNKQYEPGDLRKMW